MTHYKLTHVNAHTHTHTHTHICIYILFHFLFHYGLSRDIEYSSLCYPVETCCLSMCLVAQLCPTLWDPMDCSHEALLALGILQTRILEWVFLPSSRGSSQPRDQNQVSHIADRFFTICPLYICNRLNPKFPVHPSPTPSLPWP